MEMHSHHELQLVISKRDLKRHIVQDHKMKLVSPLNEGDLSFTALNNAHKQSHKLRGTHTPSFREGF